VLDGLLGLGVVALHLVEQQFDAARQDQTVIGEGLAAGGGDGALGGIDGGDRVG
jgi:hypothetical protein